MSIYDANLMDWDTAGVSQNEEAGMQYIINTGSYSGYENNAHFFGYIQPDEALTRGLTGLDKVYRDIKSVDPNHVVLATDWSKGKSLESIADITLNDLYAYRDDFIGYAGGRHNALYYHEYNLKYSHGCPPILARS